MNKYTLDILEKSEIAIKKIHPAFSKNTSEREKFSLKKIFELLRVISLVFYYCVFSKVDSVYTVLNSNKNAFLKDYFIILFPILMNKKLLIHLHCANLHQFYEDSPKYIKSCMRVIISKKTTFLVLSEGIKKKYLSIIPGNKMRVIPNGLDFPKYSLLQENCHSNIVCLYVGILIKGKGFFKILETANRMKNEKIIFHLVGPPGPDFDKQEVDNFLEENNLQNKVFFHGAKYSIEKERAYANSDIFLFPTSFYCEAFPLVILEAIAYGLPVITTTKGAIPEIIESGVNGLLLDTTEPEEIAEKLKFLCNNESVRIKMSENNVKKFNEKYAFHNYEKRILEIFNN